MARYALVDQDGLIAVVIAWGGEAELQPPSGLPPVRDEAEVAATGGIFDGKAFLPPIEEEPAPQPAEPASEDRIAALEQKLADMESRLLAETVTAAADLSG